mgnify:CR=1 FL=1
MMQGFTLLELLVVLAIVGAVSVGVMHAWSASPDRALDRQVAQLQAQIEVVRAYTRAAGITATLSWDDQGVRWGGLPQHALPELPRFEPWMRPGTSASLDAEQPYVAIGPEPMGTPWRLTLEVDARQRTLVFDGWSGVDAH